MDILNKVKKLKRLAAHILENHREPLKIILKDNFNSESFAKLRKGKIVISREILRYHIKQALEQEPAADLDFIAGYTFIDK